MNGHSIGKRDQKCECNFERTVSNKLQSCCVLSCARSEFPPIPMPVAAGFATMFNSPLRIAAGGLALTLLIATAIGGYLAVQQQPYEFSQNQKISASSPFRLTFAAEMNHESVEQYLTLPEGVEVTKEWKDEMLVLQPLKKLEA